MPQTKDGPSSPTVGPTPGYAEARKRLSASPNVSAEEAKQQILANSPTQSESVSYGVIKKDGVSMLQRSVKPFKTA